MEKGDKVKLLSKAQTLDRVYNVGEIGVIKSVDSHTFDNWVIVCFGDDVLITDKKKLEAIG